MTQRRRPDAPEVDTEEDPVAAGRSEAFADRDVADRGLGRGQFSSPILDRVSLDSAAPALRTDARRLDDAELAQKLTVASEVLERMVRALEGEHAQLQLVLDGSPRRSRPLLEGVQIHPSGQLDVEAVTHRLRSQPPSEQRQLLQQGLEDLLERALNHCMERLPGPQADALLAEVLLHRKGLS